jgi:hypothetical protein
MNISSTGFPPALLALGIVSTAALGQATPAADADVNRDGIVSQAEAEYSNALRLQFDELDRNRDGRLDPTEVTGLAPAPPGAVPVLPNSAIGRPPGTVTTGGGTAGATTGMTGVRPSSRSGSAVGTPAGAAVGAPPSTSALPGAPSGPATGSPFGSPFNSADGGSGLR